MKNKNENICLVDLDGTLCDYAGALQAEMNKLSSPMEPPFTITLADEIYPDHLWQRMKLIKENGDWWENLPRFKLGFDVLDWLKEEGFYVSILTQGPKENHVAWSHKVKWCLREIPEIDITITRNKGLVYGKILVDDYPEYIKQWLDYRPRGLVIMPAQKWNEGYSHPNVIRYDGRNIAEVRIAIGKAKERKVR